MARVFVDRLIGLHLQGKLDAATASMAKYWVSDPRTSSSTPACRCSAATAHERLPIARMFRDSRVQRIYGGANEIMKVLIARTL